MFGLLNGNRKLRTILRGTDTSDQAASVLPLLKSDLAYETLLKPQNADCLRFKLHSNCFDLLMSEKETLTRFPST